MPATTSKRLLPYPLGSDRVMDGDDQIRKLAQSVENMVQSNLFSVTPTANTPTLTTITFPLAYANATGLIVVVGIQTTSFPAGTTYFAWTQSITAADFVCGVLSSSASARTMTFIAVGPVAAVA